MFAGEIVIEDARAEDVRGLLEQHLVFANQHTPPEDLHALDIDGLLQPSVTLFGYRADGALIAIGALKRIEPRHGELKSMHTARAARGRGIGRAMVDHLIQVACERGYHRVSLETGSMVAFAPARSLYASAGFQPCAPFGGYRASKNSTFMT